MNKNSDTISRADAEQYARAIKNEFGNPIYTWRKGKFKCTYLDLDNGYDLRILCISKQEGQMIYGDFIHLKHVETLHCNVSTKFHSSLFPIPYSLFPIPYSRPHARSAISKFRC
ncbi:MAG: hypothetical protein QNJ47_27010 [Nostocaceae cyanobacterium]|nr:hypothetical protein [Nostocaceae cyanobacterium]